MSSWPEPLSSLAHKSVSWIHSFDDILLLTSHIIDDVTHTHIYRLYQLTQPFFSFFFLQTLNWKWNKTVISLSKMHAKKKTRCVVSALLYSNAHDDDLTTGHRWVRRGRPSQCCCLQPGHLGWFRHWSACPADGKPPRSSTTWSCKSLKSCWPWWEPEGWWWRLQKVRKMFQWICQSPTMACLYLKEDYGGFFLKNVTANMLNKHCSLCYEKWEYREPYAVYVSVNVSHFAFEKDA